jgi:hypothetical protein
VNVCKCIIFIYTYIHIYIYICFEYTFHMLLPSWQSRSSTPVGCLGIAGMCDLVTRSVCRHAYIHIHPYIHYVLQSRCIRYWQDDSTHIAVNKSSATSSKPAGSALCFVRAHVHTYTYKYMHTHIRTYIYMYVCIYIYIYIYICLHTHIHTCKLCKMRTCNYDTSKGISTQTLVHMPVPP